MNQNLTNLETFLFYLTVAAYLFSMVLYWGWFGFKSEMIGRFATLFAIIGLGANTGTIIIRTIIAQRPPLSNGYEFILTFCWGIMAVFLVSEFRFHIKSLGSFILPIPFLLLGYTITNMSYQERLAQAIPPALKSQWLTYHVITAMLAYGGFAISFGLGIMYLIKMQNEVQAGKKSKKVSDSRSGGAISRIPSTEILDELAYKMVGFSFPLLTLCIITGAIWANYAWGTYWSWDPKETWSLITWIIYAGYLHARLMFGWQGKRAAMLAVVGFLAVLFTFFGVNYFLPGLHSYAKT